MCHETPCRRNLPQSTVHPAPSTRSSSSVRGRINSQSRTRSTTSSSTTSSGARHRWRAPRAGEWCGALKRLQNRGPCSSGLGLRVALARRRPAAGCAIISCDSFVSGRSCAVGMVGAALLRAGSGRAPP
eukprot:430748-Prymnesium_polylepis.2